MKKRISLQPSHLFLFPLKYFDYLLINYKGAHESASAFYFLGRKSNKILNDNDLLKEFKGF